MTNHRWFVSLVFLITLPGFAQLPSFRGGYKLQEPIDIAPGQVILISTYGVPVRPARGGFSSSVSLPETELDGIRASIRYTGFSAFPVQFLGIRQTGCENNASLTCDPLTSFTLVMPAALPPVAMPADLVINDHGTDVRTVPVRRVPDRIHVVTTCDEVAVSVSSATPGQECGPVIRRPTDGHLITATEPARSGDTIVVWAYGLGLPGRQVEVDGGRFTTVLNSPVVRFVFGPADFAVEPTGPGIAPLFVAAFPPTPLYQINIRIPDLPQTGNLPVCDGQSVKSNVTMLLSGLSSMDVVRFCVVP